MHIHYVIKSVIVIYTSVLVAACSGGSSPNESSDANTMVKASFTINAPSAHYEQACSAPSIQFVLPVHLNSDSYSDFIIHYWCNAPGSFGSFIDTPTPDALVALVSEGEGIYKVANEEIFGASTFGLGGASRKVDRKDINNDGLDDFAFAMNWEDGRSAEISETNSTNPSLLLSENGDRYSVVRLGQRNWGHATGFISYANGSSDAAFAGFLGIGLEAFRYQNSEFINVSSDYPDDSHEWAAGFIGIERDGVTEYIAASANQLSNNVVTNIGIKLYKRNNEEWNVIDTHWLPVDFNIDFLTFQETAGTATVMNIDGNQFVGGAFEEFCVMPPLTVGGAELIVGKFASMQLISGQTIVEGLSYDQDDFSNVNTFVFAEFSENGINVISSPIVGEEQNSSYNFFDCKDLNQDGLPDLVAYAFTRPGFNERVEQAGKPSIYLNNGEGQLVFSNISMLPGHTSGNELQSQMLDVDGDGIMDLMLYGSAADGGGGDFEVHLLSRGL